MYGAILVTVFLSVAAPAVAAQEGAQRPAPKLRLVGSGTIEFTVLKEGFWDHPDKVYTATAHVLLANDGSTSAPDVEVRAYTAHGESLDVRRDDDGPQAIARGGTVVLALSFEWSEKLPVSGWLVVHDSQAESGPVVSAFSIVRVVPPKVLAKNLWAGGLASIIVLGIAHMGIVSRKDKPFSDPTWGKELRGAPSGWSFKDGWASSLTALGATLGTVLGATGFIEDALPGVSLGGFVGMSLLFGFLVLLAPVAFVSWSKGGKGTYGGLLVASALTLTAAVGEISTVSTLLTRTGVTRWWTAPAIIVVLGLLTLYTYRSFVALLSPKVEGEPVRQSLRL